MMARWLSSSADESAEVADGQSHWQAELNIIATGNELCKSQCPDCETTMFDLTCPRCGYEDERDVHVLTGTITDVDESSFVLTTDNSDFADILPDGPWVRREEPGFLERARGNDQPEERGIQFRHDFPVDGVGAFASIAQEVEVLAVVDGDTVLALEVNG